MSPPNWVSTCLATLAASLAGVTRVTRFVYLDV